MSDDERPELAITDVQYDGAGIMVTVSMNGQPQPQTSGSNMIAAHRPTRFALMMRRQRANAARKQGGRQQLPAILPGDCEPCAGLGVIGSERERCPRCHGSGER